MFRAQLLAAKQINATASPVVANVPLKEKLRAELSKYVILVFVVFFISFIQDLGIQRYCWS